MVSKLGILPPDLVHGIVTVYGELFNTQQEIDHFISRGDVSRAACGILDKRVASLSNKIQPIAVNLAAFANFKIADDAFRKFDDAVAAKSAKAYANTTAEAVTDQPDRSD